MIPICCIVILSTLPTYLIQKALPLGFIYSIIVIISSVIFSAVTMFYIGLDKNWRKKIAKLITNKLKINIK